MYQDLYPYNDLPESVYLLSMRVDSVSYESAAELILAKAKAGGHAYVCAANVHMTMECHDSPEFRSVVNGAMLVTPDGMPLVWYLRMSGYRDQRRVYGPSLMLECIKAAEREGLSIGLYGGSEDCLTRLARELGGRYPRLKIAYVHSPPFRDLTPSEDAKIVEEINDSGVDVLFVGLGCPKQERWMYAHAAQLRPVQIGVGAAFAFHAGLVPQAPRILQRMGLEWLFRLACEPRRLWRRYLWHNPRFIFFLGLSLVRKRPSVNI